MNIFHRFVAAGRALRFSNHEHVSPVTRDLAFEQVCMLLAVYPANALRSLRAHLDVELVDCVAHQDQCVREDLEDVRIALDWVAENASSGEVARQVIALEEWLAGQMAALGKAVTFA